MPFVARRLARIEATGTRWFNWLGLAGFAVAIAIGTMTAPGALHSISAESISELLTALPFTLIPTLAVPLFAALHIISLRLLANPAAPPVVVDHEPVRL